MTNANGTWGPDGLFPLAGGTTDHAGNMYGIASLGGANWNTNGGMLWDITAAGVYLDLHDFNGTVRLSNGTKGSDGFDPNAGVTVDAAGNLYGTTLFGGLKYTCGMVWEITRSGTYRDLHDFGGSVTNSDGTIVPDGVFPYSNVAFDSAGKMYGTTNDGGSNKFPGNYAAHCGMIWEIAAVAVSDLIVSPASVQEGSSSRPFRTKWSLQSRPRADPS